MINSNNPMVSRLYRGKSLLHNPPIEVFEEGVDVFSLAGGTVVEQKGVFPHVEREDYGKCGEMTHMLFTHKSCLEFLADRVVVEDSPAGASHAADGLEVFREISVIFRREGFSKGGSFVQRFRTAFELREIQ